MYKLAIASMVAATALAAAPAPVQAQSPYQHGAQVTCTSRHGQYRSCALPMRGSVRLVRQLSSRPCVRGRSWGPKGSSRVWVSRGCRAVFTVRRDRRYEDNRYGDRVGNDSRYDDRREGDGRYQDNREGDNGYGDSQYGDNRDGGYGYGDNRYGDNRDGDNGYGDSGYGDGRDGDSRYGERRDDDNGGNWTRDLDYSVSCRANGRRSTCAWDPRYGTPSLVQLNSGTCEEGRDWGYDGHGRIWVDADCNARFGYRY